MKVPRARRTPPGRRAGHTGQDSDRIDEPALAPAPRRRGRRALQPDDAVRRLRRLPFADLGFARVDHHRALRQGLPEAVYGPGKTPEQSAAIVVELLGASGPVLLTRADTARSRRPRPPPRRRPDDGVVTGYGRWRRWPGARRPRRDGRSLVVTAGTADLPVAAECVAVLDALGFGPELLADCGVAGLHRLLAAADGVAGADAVVVVAGMEGALASVVGGMTGAPVVAVPTSVGYGAASKG